MDVSSITGSHKAVFGGDVNNNEVVTKYRLDMAKYSVLPIHSYTDLIDRNIEETCLTRIYKYLV